MVQRSRGGTGYAERLNRGEKSWEGSAYPRAVVGQLHAQRHVARTQEQARQQDKEKVTR